MCYISELKWYFFAFEDLELTIGKFQKALVVDILVLFFHMGGIKEG